MQYAFNREPSPYTQYAEQHAHTRYNAILALFFFTLLLRDIQSFLLQSDRCFLVKLRVIENRVIKTTGIMEEIGRDILTLFNSCK